MKKIAIIKLIISTLFLSCSQQDQGRRIYSTSYEEYTSSQFRWFSPSFECNEDQILVDLKEEKTLNEIKTFVDSLGLRFLIKYQDSTELYFRWEYENQDEKAQYEIQGYISTTSTEKNKDSIFNQLLKTRRMGELIKRTDSVQITPHEKQIITKLYDFVLSKNQAFGLIDLDARYSLEIRTNNRGYDYKPKTMISCDAKERFTKLYKEWLINDYELIRKRKEYDTQDPWPYEVIDNKDYVIRKYRVRDADTTFKPCNLRDAHMKIERILNEEKIEVNEQTEMIRFHFGLGMWMRNNWGLWSGKTHLTPIFEKNKIDHPDDISGFILDSFKEYYLNKKDTKKIDNLYIKWNDINCRQ